MIITNILYTNFKFINILIAMLTIIRRKTSTKKSTNVLIIEKKKKPEKY